MTNLSFFHTLFCHLDQVYKKQRYKKTGLVECVALYFKHAGAYNNILKETGKMIDNKRKQFITSTSLTIALSVIMFSPSAFAQNVFPITIGGEERIYMDSNEVEGIDSGDRYFTLKRVTLEDAEDDTGKSAIIVELQGKEYQSIYVLDGLDGDGGLEIHEPQIDVAYLDDNGNKITVQNKWAHIGETGAPSDYEGFIHSVTFGMSDSNAPYHGYNNMSWQIERGSALGGNIKEASVTVEYNNDEYADTLRYDTGGVPGDILMDINTNKDRLNHDDEAIKEVFGNYGLKVHPVQIPVDTDGNILLTDGEDDGFFMKFALKPVRTDNGQPTRLPPENNRTTAVTPAVNMLLLQQTTEPNQTP